MSAIQTKPVSLNTPSADTNYCRLTLGWLHAQYCNLVRCTAVSACKTYALYRDRLCRQRWLWIIWQLAGVVLLVIATMEVSAAQVFFTRRISAKTNFCALCLEGSQDRESTARRYRATVSENTGAGASIQSIHRQITNIFLHHITSAS